MFGAVAFVSIREYRIERFREAALREAALRSLVAAESEVGSISELVDELGAGRAEVLVASGSGVDASGPVRDLDRLPATVVSGERVAAVSRIGGRSYLVISEPVADRDAVAYFLFDRARLQQDIAQMARTLVLTWAVLTSLVGLLSTWLARRALTPIRAAAEAASDLATGLVGTRSVTAGADEFSAWANSFVQMTDALERRIERERRFNADVAHELRTPVATTLAAASLLETHLDALPREARRPAELIVQELRRLRRLVDDLLEISVLERGRSGDLRLEDVELGERVRRLCAQHGWVEVSITADPPVRVETDGRRVDRVVGNLIGNALRHGAPPVEVFVRSEGERAVVEVVDHGEGIRGARPDQLFEPFFKADADRPGPGSGLGLAIAAHQARVLRGRLTLESQPGETRFSLVLPVQPARTVESSQEPA